MDRQARLVLNILVARIPLLEGRQILAVITDLVLLADVGDPAVESVEHRAVTQITRLAERAVEIDLDRRTALVFRRLVGVLDTVGKTVVLADQVAFSESGVQGERRHIDRDRKLGLGALVGHTERNVEVGRGHELAFEVFLLLLGARLVTVDKLAAELGNDTVGPVLRHLERRSRRNFEFVLVFEPDALLTVVDRDFHAVVAQLSIDLGLDGEEIFRKYVLQVEGRHQRDGVITARDRDPRVVVGGQRTLQAAAEFEVVALLADGGTFSLITGQVEIVDVDGGGLQLILESHALLLGIDLVDRNLGRSRNRCDQGSRQ